MTEYYETEDAAWNAAKEESARLAVTGEYIDFDGNNCADAWDEDVNCAGWSGNERRCQCSNRRVSWVTSEVSDGKWIYYAEAW